MRMKTRIVTLFLVATLALLVMVIPLAWAAQPPPTVWDKTFGGTGYDLAYSVQQTSDGGCVLAGWTGSYGAGNTDAWLIKTDSSGNQVWDKTFGGINNDAGLSARQTSDGGYILAGGTESYGAGGNDAWLIKTDSSGNQVWDKTFGGTDYDLAYSVQQTSDGGYVLAGWTASYGAGGNDAWLIKTDSSGNQTWDTTFGGTNGEQAYSVQQTSDGGYVLAGWTASNGTSNNNAWLIKTDSSGNKTWDKAFGGANGEEAYSVQQTSDGGYVLAGWTASYGAGSYDAWLVKTDSSGNKTWDKTFGGTSYDGAFSVRQTSDGGYVLAGYTYSYGAVASDAWLIKTDSSGNNIWDKTFGGTGGEQAYSVQQTSDGGYVLAGYTDSYGAGSWDAWLIKVDSSNAPLPTVASISPNTGVAGWTVNVTSLAGTGFQAGASVRLELGATVVDATSVTVVSATQITCQIALPGTPGKYDVVVKNPDGQEGRLTEGFSVTNVCGQGAGAVVVGFGLMMGLLSLGGSGLLRRRLGKKSRAA